MNEQFTPTPLLYILMRTDLASMNPGKAVAQGSHAAHQFVFDLHQRNDEEHEQMFTAWANETAQGFGTCITLAVNERQLHEIIDACKAAGKLANITHDPTYPLRDGEFTHFIPLDTCGYVFGYKDELSWFLGDLPLMA